MSHETQGLFLDADEHAIGVNNTQGDIMDSRSYDVFAKLGYWFDNKQNLEFSVNRFQLEGDNNYTSVDGNLADGSPTTSINQTPIGRAPRNRVLNTSLTYKNYDPAGMEFTAQAYRQEFEALFAVTQSGSFVDPALAPDGIDQPQNESDKNGAKITLTKDGLFNVKLKLTTGIDLLKDTTQQRLLVTNRNYVPETTFKNYAPFIQAQLKLVDFLVLNCGLSYEHAELDVDSYQTVFGKGGVLVDGGKTDFSETLFNIGAVVNPTS